MHTDKIYSYFTKSGFKKIIPVQYEIINRKKLVTYAPVKFLDKLMFELSCAGAGKIGNYSLCSFIMKGIGTFKPSKDAKPFSGTKNKLSYEEEVRLEMEFDDKDIDKIIDTLLEVHPYEEPAYEIYDFKKRSIEPSAFFCVLKEKTGVTELIKIFNKAVNPEWLLMKNKFTKIIFTENDIDERLINTAKDNNAECIIRINKSKVNFKLL